MKILYMPIMNLLRLQPGHMTYADALSDSVFHGLRSELGHDIVDSLHLWHLYKSGKNRPDFKTLYGKGFTMGGCLEDIAIDRSDIHEKIKNKFYDLVILASHCTTAPPTYSQERTVNTVEAIKPYYPKNKLFFIDTLDQSHLWYDEIAKDVTYFKRESIDENTIPLPISVPKEKIQIAKQKTRDFAHLIPYKGETYIYDDEQAYFDSYNESYFGYTCKKGGWGTNRSYEILACCCVPYFTDIEGCPKRCLYGYPKDLCVEAKKIKGVKHAKEVNIRDADNFKPGFIDRNEFDENRYNDLAMQLYDWTKKYLTTEVTARKILDKYTELNEGYKVNG